MLDYWNEFFDELQNVRGRSLNTISAYRRDLYLFEEYKRSSHFLPGFYDYMKKKGLSQRSQARVVSSLRTYFRFCERQGRKSPELRELKLPRVENKLPQVLSKDEFEKLMTASQIEGDYLRSYRNQLTLLLLFGLGCRVSELTGLNLTDYQKTDRWLSVTGKARKQRIIPLTEKLCEHLNVYIKDVRPYLLKKKNEVSILINERGKRPSRIDIWRWLSHWSKMAGFNQTLSPHQFRHGCATALLESGADLKSIQMLLGHTSIQTTQIYTSVSTSQIEKAIDKTHPLSRWTD